MKFIVEVSSWRGNNWRNKWIRWASGQATDHMSIRVHTDCNRMDYTLNVDAGEAKWVSTPHLMRLYRSKFEHVDTKVLGPTTELKKTTHRPFRAVQLILWWYVTRWFTSAWQPDSCVRAVREAAEAHGYPLVYTQLPDIIMESL